MNNQIISSEMITQTSPFSIMVTGSTGFIGSRLVSLLSSSGYTVTALSRKKLENTKNVKYVQADVFNEDQLSSAMSGIEVAYYLLHSMEGSKSEWQEFASRERKQAENFLNGVGAVILRNHPPQFFLHTLLVLEAVKIILQRTVDFRVKVIENLEALLYVTQAQVAALVELSGVRYSFIHR